jgi:uncharacterized membrane protein
MLPGLKSMLNIHPLFVHFPIALWFAALLYEALAIWRSNDDWHRTSVRLLFLGTIAASFAVLTGWYAGASVPPSGPVQNVFSIHETIMLITTAFAIALCLFCIAKRTQFTVGSRRVLLVGLIVLAILTTIGADRGAQMVYQYATSVNLPGAPQ